MERLETRTSIPLEIHDMTGPTPSIIGSLSDSQIQSHYIQDSTQHLPELRHNLRAIVDLSQLNLITMTRNLGLDRGKLKKTESSMAITSSKLTQLLVKKEILDSILTLGRECRNVAIQVENDFELNFNSNQVLKPFQSILNQFSILSISTYLDHQLDELIISTLSPTLRICLNEWEPLTHPLFLSQELKSYSALLHPTKSKSKLTGRKQSSVMTPFESFLWTYWLPKIRQAIK